MVAFCKYRSFCYMIPFFVNILCGGGFGAIAYPSKGFKFVTFRFDNVTVIDMDDRLIRAPFFYLCQVRYESIFWSAFCKMPGKAVNDIDFSCRFM